MRDRCCSGPAEFCARSFPNVCSLSPILGVYCPSEVVKWDWGSPCGVYIAGQWRPFGRGVSFREVAVEHRSAAPFDLVEGL